MKVDPAPAFNKSASPQIRHNMTGTVVSEGDAEGHDGPHLRGGELQRFHCADRRHVRHAGFRWRADDVGLRNGHSGRSEKHDHRRR